MNEKLPSHPNNLQAIMSAIRQNSDVQRDPEARVFLESYNNGGVGPLDWGSLHGNDELYNVRRVPTKRDQLEIMQNCIIVNQGQLLQSASSSGLPRNLERNTRGPMNPPNLSDSMKTKLKISPEVSRLAKEMDQLEYVLFNVFYIIERCLCSLCRDYCTEVKYTTDRENSNWTRVKIHTKLYNVDFNTALCAWEQVCNEVERFINLSRRELGTQEVDQINDLISIEFDSGDQ